ncbi:MAG TPA: hypothetical protein VM451_10185 [Candidatus Limnocylindria bacterium]|nr:hypothetical protein [Candidatus Limnocylindria bacterium]
MGDHAKADLANAASPHEGESMVGPHGTMDDHGGDHGHDDHNMGEGHGAAALGAVDVRMWGAAALGIALGLIVVWAFVSSLS